MMALTSNSSWTEVTLGEIVEIFDYKRIPLSGENRNERQGEYPYYGASGIIDYIDDYLFEGRYLLIAEDGENLKSRNLPLAFFASGKFWVNNHAHIVKAISGIADDYFLFSWFEQSNLTDYITGAAQPKLSQDNLKRITLNLPPLPEQTAIATALSDVDNLITSLNKLIDKKRNIKQGTMQELLTGKKRLPGFNGEWEVTELKEILLNGTLGGNYSNLEIESNFPLIKMGNIGRGQIDVSKLEYISSNITPLQKDKLIYGDVLFNTRNTLELVGKVAIWRNELPVAYYNSNLMKLEFNDKIVSNFFINYILNTKYSISQLRGFATGTTSVAAIYTRDLLKFKLPLPSLPEQQSIAQILTDMDTEIHQLEQKRDKYTLLKQGMMQQLLTGKIRLI